MEIEKNKVSNSRVGFTLIEVLIVIGIMAILSIAGSRNFVGYRNKNRLKLAGDEINSMLRTVRDRAISQEENSFWGVYFRNVGGTSNYMVVYYGKPYGSGHTTSSIKYLDNSITFLKPASNNTTTTQFSALSGKLNNSSPVDIEIALKADNKSSSTIIVYPNGRVEY